MSRFEDKLREMRRMSGDDYYLGLETVAEGLAEVIELLRPLVDTVTAQPEPLKLRTQAPGMPCLSGDPGSNGFRRCMEPWGHDGDHRHRDASTGVEYAWTQRHGDVPSAGICAVPYTDRGRAAATQCAKALGHDGQHADGRGVFWRTEPQSAAVTPGAAMCRSAKQRVSGTVRCVLDLGHDGQHSAPGHSGNQVKW